MHFRMNISSDNSAFSLGLMAPFAWYQVAFAIWMALLAA